jgi:hypothetical protein
MKFLENFMRYNIYMYYFNAQVDTSLNYNIIKMTFVITIVIIIFISNFIFYKNKKMKIFQILLLIIWSFYIKKIYIKELEWNKILFSIILLILLKILNKYEDKILKLTEKSKILENLMVYLLLLIYIFIILNA